MDTKTILTLFGLNYEEIIVKNEIIENDDEYIILAEAKETLDRACPKCGNHGYVKEKINCYQNLTLHKFNNKNLTLVITKRRFGCRNCNITWTQKLPYIEKNRRITNDVIWTIFSECKKIKSFSDIAKEHGVSTPTVINIFDEMCKEKPQPLRICVCVDEFYFKVTEYNKYPAVLSDAKTGRILDIIPSRKFAYLDIYFKKKNATERETVKYFSCDLNDTYRRIAYKRLPNALVIADFFHVTKLFTKLIDIKRVKFMKKLNKSSFNYKILKKYRKLFVADESKLNEMNFYMNDGTGNKMHISDIIYNCTKDDHELLEMHCIYRDYQKYMAKEKGTDLDSLAKSLEFIINRCLSSIYQDVNTLGNTLLDWSTEILNAYSDLNVYNISNGMAESNNNRIEKLIEIGYGYRNLNRLTKRILLMEKHNKSRE